uniref:FAD-binding domain-containing protein n=1 Tax=Psilocybe cubensis TaxID=181762 RepID=A0A8H8CHC0_PSICU
MAYPATHSFCRFADVTVTALHSGGNTTYKFVVGADGAKSVVRKQLGLAFIGETMEQRMIVGDFIGDAPFFINKWGWWRDNEDNVTAIRPTNTPGKFTFFTGGYKNVKYAEICSSDDAVKESILKGTGGRTDIKIEEFVWRSPYRVNVRMTETFRKGRVFIVGDAGHVHSPAGAQGLNTGIQDSYNLGWKLALVIKSLAPPTLLDSYNDERVPLVAEMLNITTELLLVGRKALSVGREEATLKRAENLSQLGVNYRGSPMIIDEEDNIGNIKAHGEGKAFNSRYGNADRGSVVKAGDRAPDAPGLAKVHHTNSVERPTTRLFKLLTPAKHSVLILYDLIPNAQFLAVLERLQKVSALGNVVQVFVIKKPGVIDIIDTSQSPLAEQWISVFEDRGGHVHDAYADPDFTASIFVVRPDGIIGARAGKDSDEILEKYFACVFL